MFDISFEYPFIFLLIIPFILCSFFCKQKTPVYIMPHLNIFNESKSNSSILIFILQYFIIISSFVALSSPIKIKKTQIIKKNGIDIVLSVDASGSMNELGFNPNNQYQTRFQVVKEIIKDFIPKRINDNIALIVFGNSVMMASPLSFDKEAQGSIIDYFDVGIVGEQTAIIDSLVSSVNILKTSKAKSKIIILLTDGEDNVSKIPLYILIKLLKKYKIKVYTIGIGIINKVMLNQIAKASKGESFFAYSKQDLIQIYKKIDTLEKSKIKGNKIILKEYLFFYPLFLATMLLILFIFLKNKDYNYDR